MSIERLREEIAIAHDESQPLGPGDKGDPQTMIWVNYSDGVLERHQWGPVSYGDDADVVCRCGYITADEDTDHCPEIRALGVAWLGEGWDK